MKVPRDFSFSASPVSADLCRRFNFPMGIKCKRLKRAKFPIDPINPFPEEISGSGFLYTVPETVYVYICSYKCTFFSFPQIIVYYTLYIYISMCVCVCISLSLSCTLLLFHVNDLSDLTWFLFPMLMEQKWFKNRFVSSSIRRWVTMVGIHLQWRMLRAAFMSSCFAHAVSLLKNYGTDLCLALKS